MRVINNLALHPEVRKERFPAHLWPTASNPRDIDESWILLEFLQAVGTVPQKAPRKLVPPMPDLECNIAGERRLFELGEVLESQLAEGLAHSLKQSRLKGEALRRGDN